MLKDVSVDIRLGEVVGVIGRNGSGKSTLLKILSRITPPTEGEFHLRGRLGSLLEVGTGFHPELTGRENVFLNGILLGMTRREIAKNLDDIFSFAGVEKFADTPVKRYSSGMYVRLAFAVAAHLETEILILDEVLAVGDQAFQRRCLGKVGEVARSGRTVLIVSHNLSVVQSSCTVGVLLQGGRLIAHDKISTIIRTYAVMDQASNGFREWPDAATAPHFMDKAVRLVSIGRCSIRKAGRRPSTPSTSRSRSKRSTRVIRPEHVASIHLYFRNELGQTIFVTMDDAFTKWHGQKQPVGIHRARCRVPGGLLSDGMLRVEYLICTHPTTGEHVTEPDALVLTITDALRPSPVRGAWYREWPTAMVRPYLEWEYLREPVSRVA